MKNVSILAVTAVALLGFFTPTAAQEPAAVVEAVKGDVLGVEFMDYVSPGSKIALGSAGSIVLSYTRSCRREIITGGTVTVGTEQSEVDHGKVESTVVDCDANHIRLLSPETRQSAATVFRGVSPDDVGKWMPRITLYGTQPIVEMRGPGILAIERVDEPGERRQYAVSSRLLERGRFYDFAKTHQALVAGATYVATLGPLSIVFRVDGRAKAGSTPIVGRLLQFAAPY